MQAHIILGFCNTHPEAVPVLTGLVDIKGAMAGIHALAIEGVNEVPRALRSLRAQNDPGYGVRSKSNSEIVLRNDDTPLALV